MKISHPQSDDVNKYVKEHPLLIIPFRDQLVASVTRLQVTNNSQYSSRSRVSKALPSVQWSRRGQKRLRNDLSSRQASTIVKGPAGISTSCPIDLHIDTCDVEDKSDEEEELKKESEDDEYITVTCPTRGKMYLNGATLAAVSVMKMTKRYIVLKIFVNTVGI